MSTLIAGLSVGAIYALVAIGYSITYQAARVVNFAQGYLLMLGTFVAYDGLARLGLPVPLAIILCVVIVGAINGLVELIAIRPLRDKGSHTEMVTTVGAATMILGIIALIWGSDPLRIDLFKRSGQIEFLGGSVDPTDLWIIGLVILAAVAVTLLSRYTRYGLASLAVAENSEAATLRGINVRVLSTGSFIAAGALAGLLAPVIGVKTYAIITLGPLLAIKGFVVLALGGLGSYMGSLIAAGVIGYAEALVARYYDPILQNLVVYILFVGLLLIRPRGLFGSHHEREV